MEDIQLKRQGRVSQLQEHHATPRLGWKTQAEVQLASIQISPLLVSLFQGLMSLGCSRQQEIPFPLFFASFPSLAYGGHKCFFFGDSFIPCIKNSKVLLSGLLGAGCMILGLYNRFPP